MLEEERDIKIYIFGCACICTKWNTKTLIKEVLSTEDSWDQAERGKGGRQTICFF